MVIKNILEIIPTRLSRLQFVVSTTALIGLGAVAFGAEFNYKLPMIFVIIAHGYAFQVRLFDISRTRKIGKYYAWGMCIVAILFVFATPRLATMRSMSDYNQLLFFFYFLFLVLVSPLVISCSLRGTRKLDANAEESGKRNHESA